MKNKTQIHKRTNRTALQTQAQTASAPVRTSPDAQSDSMVEKEAQRFFKAMANIEIGQMSLAALCESAIAMMLKHFTEPRDRTTVCGFDTISQATLDKMVADIQEASKAADKVFPKLRSCGVQCLRPSMPCRTREESAIDHACQMLESIGTFLASFDPTSDKPWHTQDFLRNIGKAGSLAARDLRAAHGASSTEITFALDRFYPRLAEQPAAKNGGAQ